MKNWGRNFANNFPAMMTSWVLPGLNIPANAGVSDILDTWLSSADMGWDGVWSRVEKQTADNPAVGLRVAELLDGSLPDFVKQAYGASDYTALLGKIAEPIKNELEKKIIGALPGALKSVVGGGVIAMYNTAMTFYHNAGRMTTLIDSLVKCVDSLTGGDARGLATGVEKALNDSIPVLVSFAAGMLNRPNLLGELAKMADTAIQGPGAFLDKTIAALIANVGSKIPSVHGESKRNALGDAAEFTYNPTGARHELWVEVNKQGEIEIHLASIDARLEGQALQTSINSIKQAYDQLVKVADTQSGGRTPEQQKQKKERRKQLLKSLESTITTELGKLVQGMQRPHERLKGVLGYIREKGLTGGSAQLANDGIDLISLLEGLVKPKDPNDDPTHYDKLLASYEAKNGGDALGHKKTGKEVLQYMTSARSTNPNVSVHGSADPIKDSQKILSDVGIDPKTGEQNLMWAPNWSHTKSYAVAVYKELKATRKDRIAIADRLKDLGDRFAKGEFR